MARKKKAPKSQPVNAAAAALHTAAAYEERQTKMTMEKQLAEMAAGLEAAGKKAEEWQTAQAKKLVELTASMAATAASLLTINEKVGAQGETLAAITERLEKVERKRDKKDPATQPPPDPQQPATPLATAVPPQQPATPPAATARLSLIPATWYPHPLELYLAFVFAGLVCGMGVGYAVTPAAWSTWWVWGAAVAVGALTGVCVATGITTQDWFKRGRTSYCTDWTQRQQAAEQKAPPLVPGAA